MQTIYAVDKTILTDNQEHVSHDVILSYEHWNMWYQIQVLFLIPNRRIAPGNQIMQGQR